MIEKKQNFTQYLFNCLIVIKKKKKKNQIEMTQQTVVVVIFKVNKLSIFYFLLAKIILFC
jgi:hypothetical protein